MYKKYFKYLKHIILSDIGIKNQDILSQKKILCIGAGGLGSPVLTYLPMFGIKEIGIVEFDTVEITNLNRQFIYDENNINKSKIDFAYNYIKKKDKTIKINTHKKKISYSNAFKIMKNYDAIIDCTDNLKSKMIISDSAIKINIPVIHASIFGFEGYVSIFKKGSFCYRCLCENYKNLEYIDYGVIGPTAGILGCIQVIEVIKLLLAQNTKLKSLEKKIMILDFKNLNVKTLNVNKSKNCNIC